MAISPISMMFVFLALAVSGVILLIWTVWRLGKRHYANHSNAQDKPIPVRKPSQESPSWEHAPVADHGPAMRVELSEGLRLRAPARDIAFTFTTGDRPLDGYTIKRGIGRGGFGEVYYAVSDGGKEVALKLVQRHLDVELRGVTQCLNLKHPNLVTIYDVKQAANGDYWIVMEFLSGAGLSDVLAANPNGLPHDQVHAWLRGIADGVGNLHEHGIVHRDLKPGNIFVENGIVKIGDYGLAKYISASRRSGQTESVGTVHYMAPEISHGRYGKEIDLYALGIILYELLTGRVPFDGQSPGEIMMKHLTAQPDVSVLPEPYRAVVARLLAKAPEDRHESVKEILEELCGERPAGQARPVASPDRVRLQQTASWHPVQADRPADARQGRRSRALKIAIAVGLSALTVAVPVFCHEVLRMFQEVGWAGLSPVNRDYLVISFYGFFGLVALTGFSWFWAAGSQSGRAVVRAAARGDSARVQNLLDRGANVNGIARGQTALIAAASRGHVTVVRVLLDRGADVNARTRGGETALSLATVTGHTAVVEVLLAAGADVNSRARDGDTPLIEAAYAGHVAILRAMLEHGPDLNARSSGDGSTPLIWAAYEGQTACVEALLEHGANVNEKDTADGSTPLIWAAYGNHPNVVRVLLDHGADPIETNSSGETALDHAGSDTITQMLEAAVARR